MEENEAVNENLMELAQRIDTAVLQKDEYALLLLISGCEARLEAEKGESRTDLYYFMANALAGIFGCKDSEKLSMELGTNRRGLRVAGPSKGNH